MKSYIIPMKIHIKGAASEMGNKGTISSPHVMPIERHPTICLMLAAQQEP